MSSSKPKERTKTRKTVVKSATPSLTDFSKDFVVVRRDEMERLTSPRRYPAPAAVSEESPGRSEPFGTRSPGKGTMRRTVRRDGDFSEEDYTINRDNMRRLVKVESWYDRGANRTIKKRVTTDEWWEEGENLA